MSAIVQTVEILIVNSLRPQFVKANFVPAFSQIQALFSLQEFDLRLEVEDETKGGRRALVFHGE